MSQKAATADTIAGEGSDSCDREDLGWVTVLGTDESDMGCGTVYASSSSESDSVRRAGKSEYVSSDEDDEQSSDGGCSYC